jgi:hypothetical protein
MRVPRWRCEESACHELRILVEPESRKMKTSSGRLQSKRPCEPALGSVTHASNFMRRRRADCAMQRPPKVCARTAARPFTRARYRDAWPLCADSSAVDVDNEKGFRRHRTARPCSSFRSIRKRKLLERFLPSGVRRSPVLMPSVSAKHQRPRPRDSLLFQLLREVQQARRLGMWRTPPLLASCRPCSKAPVVRFAWIHATRNHGYRG